MRIRTWLMILAGVALVATGCGKELNTSGPGKAAALSDITIGSCVIDQGTTPPAKAAGGAVHTIKTGVLTVGSDTSFPPFESIVKGKAVGFDVDLINAVAKKLNGLKVDYQTADFGTIFTALAAKKFDVVISAVTIKNDRKKTVDFTDPYFNADQSLTVTTAKAGSIKGVDDLAGKIVGVQTATTGEDCAKNALKAKGKVKDVRSYDLAPDAFTDLASGRIDAVLLDLPTAKQIVDNRSGLSVVQVIRTKEAYGIAVAKSNPDLRVAINKALAEIKSDGTYRTIFKKWLKTEPPA